MSFPERTSFILHPPYIYPLLFLNKWLTCSVHLLLDFERMKDDFVGLENTLIVVWEKAAIW